MIFFRGKTLLPFYFWLFFVCLFVQVTMNEIILRLVCMNILTSDGLSIIECFCKYLFDDDYCIICVILINENTVEVMLGLKCDIIHNNIRPWASITPRAPPPHNSIKWVSLESPGCLLCEFEW